MPARGFTLFEMLVVLVVLGLAIALFESRGPGGNRRLSLRAAGEEIAAGIAEAQNRAIADSRAVALHIDAAHRRWQIDGQAPHGLPAGADIAPSSAALLRFAPDGTSSGGRIELVGGASRLGIDVSWLTGRAVLDDAR